MKDLKKRYADIYITREPTHTKVGRLVKQMAHLKSSPYLDYFIYLADRVQHIEKIKRVLEDGRHVICDRYWGSSAAYQSAYDEITLGYAVQVQEPFVLKPDLTLLFDLEPKTAIERIEVRDTKSKYENIDYLKRVRENYLELASEHDWKVIDAGNEKDEVLEDIIDLVESLLKN